MHIYHSLLSLLALVYVVGYVKSVPIIGSTPPRPVRPLPAVPGEERVGTATKIQDSKIIPPPAFDSQAVVRKKSLPEVTRGHLTSGSASGSGGLKITSSTQQTSISMAQKAYSEVDKQFSSLEMSLSNRQRISEEEVNKLNQGIFDAWKAIKSFGDNKALNEVIFSVQEINGTLPHEHEIWITDVSLLSLPQLPDPSGP